jgi:hypothetical protein
MQIGLNRIVFVFSKFRPKKNFVKKILWIRKFYKKNCEVLKNFEKKFDGNKKFTKKISRNSGKNFKISKKFLHHEKIPYSTSVNKQI